MEYKAFEEVYNNPVSKMFRKDTVYLEGGELSAAGYTKNGLGEQAIILQIKYNWTDQMNLSMSVHEGEPLKYLLEPMGITDYQTAVDNLHEIMELYPGRISAQQENALLEKWATYFRGLENAFFINDSNGQYFLADCERCEVCSDKSSEPQSLEFEFSYFPAVPQSRLGKESLSVIHYIICPKCGLPSGNEVAGEFQSFAYDALEMIEDIIAADYYIYAEATPLKEAAEFIKAKLTS